MNLTHVSRYLFLVVLCHSSISKADLAQGEFSEYGISRVRWHADAVLYETPVIEGAFFKDLATMDLEPFKQVQKQFFFAVDYFSRPMAALIARLPLHQDRIDIIHNIVEEHGDFSSDRYHSNTFKQFLKSIDVTSKEFEQLTPTTPVTMFNYVLMAACCHEDPIIAIACLGIIEYAFADISAFIAKRVIERGWVDAENLKHYNLHADLDKQHAQEFFNILERYMGTAQEEQVIAGLRLGAYIFNRLYEDLYADANIIANN